MGKKTETIVFTSDGETKKLTLPIGLMSNLIKTINEEGEAAVLFSDGTYLMVKGFLYGSVEFMNEPRLVVVGGERL